MTSAQEKLKPCPFCGGEVQLETVKSRAGTLYGVVCRNTGNRGGTCAMEQVPTRTAEAAIARWNMRKPEESLRAEIERLEGRKRLCPLHEQETCLQCAWPRREQSEIDRLKAENEGLRALLDTPHTADWFEGVKLEAGHQIKRWGAENDAGKTPADWFWLIGYLAQKAMTAQMAGDEEKARHHTISTGAAMLNWFRAIVGDSTAMRPGIEAQADYEVPDFTPGNGNRARRRAEELGIDYNAATSIQVKE